MSYKSLFYQTVGCITLSILFFSCLCKEEKKQIEDLKIEHSKQVEELNQQIFDIRFQNDLCEQKKDSLKKIIQEGFENCGELLFTGKYAVGTIVTDTKFGKFGLLEMHSGKAHPESYMALYNEDDFRNVSLPNIGNQYFVRVKSINGIPLVVDVKDTSEEIQSNMKLTGDPMTNLDYHILSNHGRGAGWHTYGHRMDNSYNDGKLTIRKGTGSETMTKIVPENLRNMATKLSNSPTVDRIYYKLNSAKTTYTALDSVHRHGSLIYD